MAVKLALIAALAYILGAVSSGNLISRYVFNTDARKYGNLTYSKVHEIFKAKGAAYVLIADLFKAAAVVLIGGALLKSAGFPFTGKLAAIFFALLGQAMPITNGLKPRRNVSWSGLLLLIADWRLFLICAAAFLIATAASRRASLGALAASALFPVFVGVFYGGGLRILLAAGCSAIVIAMYGKSLLRLLLGGGGRRVASSPPDGGGDESPR